MPRTSFATIDSSLEDSFVAKESSVNYHRVFQTEVHTIK